LKRRFSFKRLFLIIPLFLIGAFLLFAFVSHIIVVSSAKGKTFDEITEIPYNKVGVVLGTSKYHKKGLNLYFKYRVEAAAKLFKEGKIDYILVSGDNGTPYYNEPKQMRKELLKLGVPEKRIVMDYAGFRTLDSIIRAKKVFQQNRFTVISQQFHNERAIFIAEFNDIELVGFNASDVSRKKGMRTKIREYFARGKAVIDIVFNVQPKFLGEEIEIR